METEALFHDNLLNGSNSSSSSALSSAVAQNSLYGLGGLLGEGVMQALQAGNGVAGVLSGALSADANASFILGLIQSDA